MNWEDIDIKITNYKLELAKTVYNPDQNRADYTYEKKQNEDPCTLNIIYNRDFYCDKETSEKILAEINTYLFEMITPSRMKEMEYKFKTFIRQLYFNEEVFIEGQRPIKEGTIIFKKEEYFRFY
jgi:hypothetical protein